MGFSHPIAPQSVKPWLQRALCSVALSGIYLGLFALLWRWTASLQFFPGVSSWGLLAGLNLGLLIGCGPIFAPVVLLAYGYVATQQDSTPSTLEVTMLVAASMTCLYALTAVLIRRVVGRRSVDFTNFKTVPAWVLASPVLGAALCGVQVLSLWYLGVIPWGEINQILLRGAVGNVSGILLVSPFVVLGCGWIRPRIDLLVGNAVAPRDAREQSKLTAWVAIVLTAAVACLLFIQTSSIAEPFPLFCLASLPLILLSLQFGLPGAAVCSVVLGFIGSYKAGTGLWTDLGSQCVMIAAAANAMCLSAVVSERNQQRIALRRQAALLNSVSSTTEQLLGMTDRDKNVSEVLRQLAAEANVSRIYVLENRQDSSSSETPVYQCSASASFDDEVSNRINSIRHKHIQLHAGALAEDQALQFRTRELPEEDQTLLLSLGIHVGIILPIFADGRWWGCLGLDQCLTDQPWLEPEVSAFKATAHVLGTLFAHANVEQQFRQFTGNIPAVFWIASPDLLRKTYVSPAYEQIWGRSCESIYQEPDSWIGAIYHEDYDAARAAIESANGGEYDVQYRVVRPNHELRWIRDTAFPVRGASGQVSRVVGIAQDITPQKEAEERLRATSILLTTLIDNLQAGIVVEDHSRRIMHVNQAFCTMFDVDTPPGLLWGMDSRSLLKHEQFCVKQMDQIIRKAAPHRGEEMVMDDRRVFRRDYIPLSLDGSCQYHLWRYEDITERRASEERIRTSLREKEVLLKEIHHRVKNNLQIISSLLSLQSTQIRDYQTAQVFRDSQSRVRAMALVHERLYQSADLARIDFGGYVEDVTNHLLRSYQSNPRGVRLNVEVDRVSLNIDTAIPCALIINELVSNSLKYAFPYGRPGEIRIRLTQGCSDEFNLTISVSFETTDSLGLQLVRSLAEQLNGTVRCRHDSGTEFDIQFRAVHERKAELVTR
jgi:PAS domain S-box-containing protein